MQLCRPRCHRAGASSFARRISPRELVDAAIARIEKHNPELGAVIIPLFEQARATAEAAPHGPFRGVPILIKDIVATVGGRASTRRASTPLREARVSRARRQLPRRRSCAAPGFVIVGKTNTSEFGIVPTAEPPAWPPSRNPYERTRSTGGSSGGSAAAVAAGMVADRARQRRRRLDPHPGELLRSVRPQAEPRPRVVRAEVRRVNGGLVNEHVVARSVRDSAAVLDVLAGMQPGDPYTAPPQLRPVRRRDRARRPASSDRLRDARTSRRGGGCVESHPDCVAAVAHAAKLLESLGHHVEHAEIRRDARSRVGAELPRDLGGRRHARARLGLARARPPDRAHEVEPLTWGLAELGRLVSGAAYANAWDWLHGATRRIADVLRELRSLAHADGHRAARPARHVQVAARRHPRRHLPRRRLRAVHRAVQRDRPARVLAAAVSQRGRAADRRAARRRVRPRGSADVSASPRRSRPRKPFDHAATRAVPL